MLIQSFLILDMSQPASSGRGQKKSRKHHRPNHAIDTFPDKYALSTPFMDTSSSSTSRIATTDTWDIIRNNHPSPSKRARTDNWPPTSLPPTSLPPHPPSTSTVEQANLEDDESEIIAARPKPQVSHEIRRVDRSFWSNSHHREPQHT